MYPWDWEVLGNRAQGCTWTQRWSESIFGVRSQNMMCSGPKVGIVPWIVRDFTNKYGEIIMGMMGNNNFWVRLHQLGCLIPQSLATSGAMPSWAYIFAGVPRWVMKMRFHSPNQKIGLNPSTWVVWNLQNYGCNSAGVDQPYSNK